MRSETPNKNSSQFDYSAHYVGECGQQYFEKQHRIALAGSALSREVFAPYISADAVVLDFGCGGGTVLAGIN